jgi:hypothetical protein
MAQVRSNSSTVKKTQIMTHRSAGDLTIDDNKTDQCKPGVDLKKRVTAEKTINGEVGCQSQKNTNN